MTQLTNQIVIENVLLGKMRGKIVYQSQITAAIASQILFVKPYDLPSGFGYQRPVNRKRCDDFSKYLSLGDDSLFTPILINAASNWEFVVYDKQRPNFGRLFCKDKASLMDGQHRMGGIQKYIQETNSDISVPFLAFHCLDDEEEIKLFDTINTKAKGIGLSLSKYLRRDSDDLSWVATELMMIKESPFREIGSIIGKRTKGRHVTLQNLYKMLHLLTNDPSISLFSKEEKLKIALIYYGGLKDLFTAEWYDYKSFRLTHIVCLDALSIVGKELLLKAKHENSKQINQQVVLKGLNGLKKVDWSVNGPLKYLKGLNGSKSLSTDLRDLMQSGN
ncbi:DGQHR domain-containing protein [Paenibacillus vini]|uniref:DGQHR domain-containing protein n=1 Tax=Paenibacillus vini TaxID=1476024 RepID=A0ABQ4MH78_9BACL|nr:DGQHR domain-containing protein [Paenibacillus vini]GIP55312.1 hypothetical protein J42TS3_43470 [Paenibacillus vini]